MVKVAYYTVHTSFFGSFEGDGVDYRKGEVVDGDDPALKRWPEYFEPLVVREHLRPTKAEKPVEQATAAPGEKRALPRQATAAEEKAIAATIEAEASERKAITTAGFKGR